ncbi:MAG: DNA helicase II / ATP-dependent DNA helicase PcrA [Bacteroidetes bacterium]|nr:MAG: DNA helicase II / ATP-dependent DNA helicase PcrA [Bacteroidota bacterium]
MKDNYLEELNDVQRAAVECTEGPVMIVAGAGSGKTRVLTYRVAHLIRKGVDPFNILSLTFTNKAARQMKNRIADIIGTSEARNLWMGTFHSVFARILRTEALRLGYPVNFTIYDTDDSKSLIKTILKEQGLDEKIYKPGLVLSRISAAKNNLLSAQAYLQNSQVMEEDRMSGKPKIGVVYEQYQKRCFKAGAMDFDDLLFNTNILLRDYPDLLNKYQDKFRYILVDEYQDTNFSQYVIVKQLAARFQNICVVGDDAQSIYAFRGANIQNILNFERDYPDLQTFKLEQNYRSTKNIVAAANAIIANNRDQIKKNVWTDNDHGQLLQLMKAMSDNEEGQIVARSIFETKMNEQVRNKDFAILYRTNAQSRSMEEALRKLNIPYRIYGGLSFYQRKEVKDMLAYFRLSLNPHDEEALKRAINYPARGIGDTTLDKVIIAARDNDVSIWTILEEIQTGNADFGINSGTRQRIGDFVTMIKSFQVMIPTDDAYTVAQHIAQQSGLTRELYSDKTPEGVSRYENVQELMNGLKEFADGDGAPAIELVESDPELQRIEAQVKAGQQEETQAETQPLKTLNQFMQDIALLTDADSKESDKDLDKVSLMTIHSSKGLEFPYVHIVGLEENLFPSPLSLNSRSDLEEERRLFYVALTRAEKRATLSYASTRYRWGNLTSCEPSRFLEEIDTRYIEYANRAAKASVHPSDDEPVFQRREIVKTATVPPKKNLVKVNAAAGSGYDNSHLKELAVGMQVQHERFGNGKVVAMEGAFPNSKATVAFEGVGQKQLLLKFAKLKIV